MNFLRLLATAGLLLAGTHVALADATYTYTLSGTQATITGFTSSAAATGALTIPTTVDGYTVVAIGRAAFKGRSALTSLSFASGSSVTTVGPQAFQSCTGLVSANLPTGLTTVPAGAFLGCTSLASASLPSGLVTIEPAAFAACIRLSAITLPASLTTIGESAFQDCSALTSLVLPSAVSALPAHAFAGCRSLGTITLSAGLVSIGRQTFAQADQLVTVTLPDSVTTIGAGAFRDSDALTTLTLGTGVVSLGDAFVAGCPALATIAVAAGNTTYASTAGVLFDAARTTLVLAPPTLAGTYTVPSTVTALAAEAFAHCRTLTGVTLPATLTTVPTGAFYYATGLTALDLPATLTTLGDWAYGGCTGLTAVTVPLHLAILGNNAFNFASSLAKATFDGPPPALTGSACFDHTAAGFTIYYLPEYTGFTTPTWMGYPTICLGTPVLAAPSVVTGGVTSRRTSAVATGTVLTTNGSTMVSRGFVYGTAAAPSLGTATIVTVGNGTGFFTATIPALTTSSTYYLRAFATNNVGTTYGTELSFTTAAPLTAPTVTSAATTTDSTPTLTGTAEAGVTVRIAVSGTTIGTTTADSAGTWTYTLSTLASGAHTIVVTAIDFDGNTAATTFTQTIVTASFVDPVPDGYAAATTGGSAGTTVLATTAGEFSTYATSSTAQVITVSGHLTIGTVAVASNKTIQGADSSATLDGCLSLSGVSNVIIRGLNLTNPDGHALQLATTTKVFVTHCTFLDCAGNQVRATGSDLLTLSWCEFAATVAGQASVQLGTTGDTATPRISLHHNWWSTGLASALPAATAGYLHQYSDYIAATGNSAATALSGSAQLFSETNLYSGVANPLTKSGTATLWTSNNTYTNCTGTTAAGTDTVFTPSYSYETLAPAEIALTVASFAGNTAGAASVSYITASASVGATATTVNSGASCTLYAMPVGVSGYSYQWRLANAPISGATNSSYAISSMSSSTAGIYTVAIGLGDGSTLVSTPLTLTLGTSTDTDSSDSGGGDCGLLLPVALALLALRRRRP